MNLELAILPLPSRSKRRSARLQVLTPTRAIFEALPLEQGRGLRLMGELCLSTTGDLVRMLDGLPAGADILDVAELSFMDSSGLHAFEQYARRLESRPLVILNAPAPVRRLFELTGAHLNPDIELRNDDHHG
jgi:anti-anti-sigma regulatory factor